LPPTSDSDADGMSGHRLVPYKASCLWLQCNRNNNSPPVLSVWYWVPVINNSVGKCTFL